MSRIKAALAPFAHFMGLSKAEDQENPDEPTGQQADDVEDERKQREGESDDDYADRMEELDREEEEARKAEEERQREEEAKRAEEQRRKEGADDVDGDDADAEDEKDDKESAKRSGRAKGARQRERMRCAAILAAGIKAGRVNMACTLAFDSQLTASQAVSTLKAADMDGRREQAAHAASQPSKRQALVDRMASMRTPNPGAGGAAAPAADSKEAWVARATAAYERAVGGKQ